MIHASRYPGPMFTFDLLSIATGGVVVGTTCLIEYFYRCSSFCCSSENENHDVLILDLRFQPRKALLILDFKF